MDNNTILSYIGSYDFLGKSIPGAILSIGFYSLLPSQQSLISGAPFTAAEIASILIVLLIAGLMIGQGVHTAADYFEKAFLWFGIRIQHSYAFLKVKVASLGYDPFTFYRKIIEKDRFSSKMESIIYDWFKKTDSWLRKRYWGGYDALAGHRHLFGKSIEWNYAIYEGSWEKNRRWSREQKGELYDRFIFAYLTIYGEDLRRVEPTDVAMKYSLITARLSAHNQTQHRNFQSIYSFCRSMWVVFLLLSVVYGVILTNVLVFDISYRPIGLYLIPIQIENWIPLFLLSISMIFLAASGTYKRHFIEYMIAEFVVAEEIEDDIVTYKNILPDQDEILSKFRDN